MMKKLLLVALIASVTAGCSITVPVAGKSENGDLLLGQAKASLAASVGTIDLYNDKTGVSCNGTYDQWTSDSVLRVKNLTCTDGSSGFGTLLRTGDTLNGSGTGYLISSDGVRTEYLFAFGDRVLHEHRSPAFWKQISGGVE